MTATTYPEFNHQTEALEVARAFSDGIRGKTILVTGVNRGGIGFATAEAFASQSPAHLVVLGRDVSRLQESIDELKKKFPNVDYRPLQVDLSSQQSVRSGAAEFLSWADVPTIDIIVNSAGVMLLPERIITEDGVEMHFATNHIGHFLFTCLVMPKLIKAAEKSPKGATRIINVSSLSPTFAQMRWSDMNFEKMNSDLPEIEQPNYQLHLSWGVPNAENLSYIPLEGYNVSKVANVLFGIGANARLYEKYGILSLALHPGVMQTELSRYATQNTKDALQAMVQNKVFTYKTLGAGASTSLVAALDPNLSLPETRGENQNHGAFLDNCQISENANPLAVSSSEAEKLWNLSEKMVKQNFTW